jgi:hypothetical protein
MKSLHLQHQPPGKQLGYKALSPGEAVAINQGPLQEAPGLAPKRWVLVQLPGKVDCGGVVDGTRHLHRHPWDQKGNKEWPEEKRQTEKKLWKKRKSGGWVGIQRNASSQQVSLTYQHLAGIPGSPILWA